MNVSNRHRARFVRILLACLSLLLSGVAHAQIIDFTGIAVETPDATGSLSHASYMTHFSVGSTSGGSTPTGADRAFGDFGGGTTYSIADSFAVMQIGAATVDDNDVYYGADMTPAPPLPGTVNDASAYMNDLNVTTAIKKTESDYNFMFTGIDESMIGDGVPDIFLVSIDKHSGGDFFELFDGSGNTIGEEYKTEGGDWEKIDKDVVNVDWWEFDKGEAHGHGHEEDLYTLGFDLGIFLDEDTTAADIANGVELLIDLQGKNNIAFVAFNTQTFDVPEAGTLLPMVLVVCGHLLFSRGRPRPRRNGGRWA